MYAVDLIFESVYTFYVCADQKFEEVGESYTLNFQNEQGDWLQVGHVPWQYVHILYINRLHTFIDYFMTQKLKDN